MITGKCAPNHEGVLCYNCVEGFARIQSQGPCLPCKENAFLYIRMVVGLLVVIIYVLVEIKLNFRNSKTSPLGILLKQLISHFQQMRLISLLDMGWTKEILEYFTIQDNSSKVNGEPISGNNWHNFTLKSLARVHFFNFFDIFYFSHVNTKF